MILDSVRIERRETFRVSRGLLRSLVSFVQKSSVSSRVPRAVSRLPFIVWNCSIETIRGTHNCVKYDNEVGMYVRAPSQQQIRQVRRHTQLKLRPIVRSTKRSSITLVDDGFIIFFSHREHSTLRSYRVTQKESFSVILYFIIEMRFYSVRNFTCSYSLSNIP